MFHFSPTIANGITILIYFYAETNVCHLQQKKILTDIVEWKYIFTINAERRDKQRNRESSM